MIDMPGLLKWIVSVLNLWFVFFKDRSLIGVGNWFFLFDFLSSSGGSFRAINSKLSRSRVVIEGDGNVVDVQGAKFDRTSIFVSGKNNRVVVSPGCEIRGCNIIVRGEGCLISIGAGTTFGGARIVNVGAECSIRIGECCMFSDHIEIWSGDSHPVYSESGDVLNKELPIVIGNNVWVGARAMILKGVTVGDGAVIGMGAIVTRDIPQRCVSAGVPNVILKNNVKWSIS